MAHMEYGQVLVYHAAMPGTVAQSHALVLLFAPAPSHISYLGAGACLRTVFRSVEGCTAEPTFCVASVLRTVVTHYTMGGRMVPWWGSACRSRVVKYEMYQYSTIRVPAGGPQTPVPVHPAAS